MHLLRNAAAVGGALMVLAQASLGLAQAPAQVSFLEGHQAAVYAVAYTPDGKTILTGSVDGTIHAWDAATGKRIRAIRDHKGPVLSLAAGRDNLTFASAGLDRRIRLFDVPSINPLAVMTGVPGQGMRIAVSADGRLLFTADSARTVRLWNVDTNAALRDYGGSTGDVTGLAVLAEAKTILASSKDGFLRSWNIDNAAAGPAVAAGPISALAADNEGKLLALGGEDGRVRLVAWPAIPGNTMATYGDQATGVAISPDGKFLVAGALDSQVTVFNGADGLNPRGLQGQPGKTTAVAVSPDSALVASGSETGFLKFWQLADGADRLFVGGHVGAVAAIAFHPKLPRIASVGNDGTIRVWRLPVAPQQLPGHSQPVQVVAVNKGGTVMATGSADKSIRLYNPADGAVLRAIEGLPQPATALAFSDDGALLAFGDSTGGLRVEGAADGKNAVTLGAHGAVVSGIAFHPDGKRLVSTGHDGSLKLWNVPAGPTVAPLAAHGDTVQSVAVSLDGRLAVTGGNDGLVQLVDTTDPKPVKKLGSDLGPTTAAAISADNSIIAAASNSGLIRFWTGGDGTAKGMLAGHTGGITTLAFGPANLGQVASAGMDGTTRVWRFPIAPVDLAAHKQPVQSIATSGDGRLVITGGADGLVQLWTTADGKPAKSLAGQSPVQAVALKKDASEAAAGDAGGLVRFFNPADGAIRAALGAHDTSAAGIAYHPTQPLLATVGADGATKVWNLPLKPAVEQQKHTDAVTAVALSADGQTTVSAGADKTVRLHNASGVRQLGGELSSAARSLAISGDGAFVVVGTDGGEARLLNTADGAVRGIVAGHTGAVTGVAIHPNHTALATAGADGLVRIWDAPVAPVSLAGHAKPLTAIALSPNGQWLATASADNTVRLWNPASNAPGPVLTGHTAPVTSIAWRADSAQIVTGSDDKSVRVWNVADGKQLALLDGSGGSVLAVAIVPDGSRVVGAGSDKAIRVWTIAEMKAVEFAGHTDAVTGLALIGNGATLVSVSADGTLRTWAMADGKAGLNVNMGVPAAALAVSADEKLFAVGGKDKSVRLLNAADGMVAATLQGAAQPITGVAVSRDNLRVAAASSDGVARVWDVLGVPQETVAIDKAPAVAVAFGADARTLYLATGDNTARVAKLALSRLIPASAMPLTSVVWTPDGQGLVTGGADKAARHWSLATGAQVRAFEGHTDAVTCVAASKDGQRVYAGGADKTLRAWKFGDGAVVATLAHPAAVRAASAPTDPNRIATAADDGSVRVWDATTGKLVERFPVSAKALTAVAIAADGLSVVSGGADLSVRRSPLNVKWLQPAHEGGATCVAFSVDGNHVVSGGTDKTVKQFDLNGALTRQFAGADAAIQCLAIRGDALQIAAGCADGQFLQWRWADAGLERKVQFGAAITSLAYSADHLRLAIAGGDRLKVHHSLDGLLLEDALLSSPANAVAFGPDPLTLVAGHADNAARVHSLSLVRWLAGHTGPVTALAWAPDGATLFTGGNDKAIFHWNLATGMQVRPFAGHADVVTGLAVSADGSRLVSASADKTLRTWTAANGQPIASYPVPAALRGLSAMPDATRAVTTGDDNVVRVWDLATGREVERVAGHEGGTARAAISGDGALVVTGGADKSAKRWSVSASLVVAADPMKIHDLAILPDGSQVVTAGEDRLVKQWDLTGKLVRQLAGPQAPVRFVSVSGDGAVIAAGGDPLFTQQPAYLWKAADGAPISTVATGAGITGLSASEEGRIAVAGADKRLRMYDGGTGRLLEDAPIPAVYSDLAFLKGGRKLLAAGADNFGYVGGLSLLGLMTGHESAVAGIAWLPEGEHLVTSGADKTVRLWSVADGRPIRTFAGPTNGVTAVSISGDGKRLAAGATDNTLRLWPVDPPGDEKAAGQVAPALAIPMPAAVRGVSLNADGTRLASTCDDGIVRLFDATSGKLLEALPGHSAQVNAVALSADGRLVVTAGGSDRTARRWLPAVLDAIAAHEGPVAGAAFSTDGAKLFTAGADKTVSEWAVAERQLVRRYTGADGPLRAVSVSSDGKIVAAGGDDMHLRLWSTADGAALAAMKAPAIVTDVIAADGGTKFVAAGADNVIRSFGLTRLDGKPALESIQELAGHTGPVAAIALAGNGRLLYSTSVDQTVRRWHAASYGPAAVLEGHAGPVYSMDFSPDNKLLASAGGDKRVRVWTLADGKPAFDCKGHERAVNAVAFNVAGTELAAGGLDGTIRVWNAVAPPVPKEGEAPKPDAPKAPALGEQLLELKEGVEGSVFALTFSRDGAQLFSAGAGKTWQSWSRKEGTLLKSFPGHNQTIYRMSYNPAGSRLATLDYSGQLMIWNASDGALLFHQQLPATTAYSFAYAPTGLEIVVGTSDPRVLRVLIPPGAQ